MNALAIGCLDERLLVGDRLLQMATTYVFARGGVLCRRPIPGGVVFGELRGGWAWVRNIHNFILIYIGSNSYSAGYETDDHGSLNDKVQGPLDYIGQLHHVAEMERFSSVRRYFRRDDQIASNLDSM
jgi:hypothetical protein